MRLPLPAADPARLRAALTTAAGLRAWWDPDATIAPDGRAAPGLDADAMAVTADAGGVTWTGDVVVARFDLAGGAVTIEPLAPLAAADREELALAWEVALDTLAWALAAGLPAPRWTRRTLPLALAYTDAWGRIDGAEGLAGGPAGSGGVVRLGGARVDVRRRLVRAPRMVVVEAGGALLRVGFGPGESVNTATIELLDPTGGAALPEGWDEGLARRLGMTWLAQLGEEG